MRSLYISKEILAILLAIIVATGVFANLNTEPVSAAVTTPARVNLTSVKAVGQNTIVVKWNWAKGATNYAVYRGGNCVVRTSTGARSFVQKGLKPGTKYSFKVRAYKRYKQTQWYNERTAKWQASIPPNDIRGPSRKVDAIKYGPYSVVRSATTSKPKPTDINTNKSLEVRIRPVSIDNRKDEWPVTFDLPTKGTLTWKTSMPSAVKLARIEGNKGYLRCGGSEGEATITAVFIPDKGYTCTGKRVVTFDIKNTIYPCNSDGSYTIRQSSDLSSSSSIYIGGYWTEFVKPFSWLESEKTIRVSVSDMDRDWIKEFEPAYPSGWGVNYFVETTDEGVARIDNREGIIFVAPGNVTLTDIEGHRWHFIVSK